MDPFAARLHRRRQKIDEGGQVVVGEAFPLGHLLRSRNRGLRGARPPTPAGATPRPTQASSTRVSTSFQTSSLWVSLHSPAISGNE